VLGLGEKLGIDDLANPNFKLAAPSRQLIIDWVLEGYNYLLQRSDMIRRGFEVCGVTSTDPERVRNDNFYKNIMRKVQEEMNRYEADELVDDDPFEFEASVTLDIYLSISFFVHWSFESQQLLSGCIFLNDCEPRIAKLLTKQRVPD